MGEPLTARNPRVKRLGRLGRSRRAREEEGVFVIDGPTLLADALAAAVTVREVFVEEGAAVHGLIDAAVAAGASVHAVAAGALSRTSETAAPQPVAAVADQPAPGGLASLLAGTDLAVMLVDVADPGNAAAILRTAEAAGAGVALWCGASADPFSPKCVRGSAGAVFRVPVVAEAVEPALARLGEAGFCRLATTTTATATYDSVALAPKLAVVLGGEARGLPPELLAGDGIDVEVTVPMVGGAESLNVAAAAAVVCFDIARRRRAGRSPRDP